MNKLPNANLAIITESKICDYLLSLTHNIGKYKAKYFFSLGFNKKNWLQLKKSLIKLCQNNEITNIELSPYGKKFIIEGELENPNKVSCNIRTVWIIENDKEIPYFVTAYPIKKN